MLQSFDSSLPRNLNWGRTIWEKKTTALSSSDWSYDVKLGEKSKAHTASASAWADKLSMKTTRH